MSLLKKLKNKLSQITTKRDADTLKSLIAQSLVRDNKTSKFNSIQDTEFKVFSQWGEDGIIQYLINKLPIENKVFVEFGVEDYAEANTRFLLENDNWSGLVMDGSLENISKIKSSQIYWKYDLDAKDIFITKDNIDSIIQDYIDENNFNKEIGLLSVDLDGNDYYVWDSIKCIDPVIVICEYNSIFGNKHSVTVPYDSEFVRTQKHYSNLYFGASLKAFCNLATTKGYEFIGVNKNSVNAFFVKKEYAQKYIEELITIPDDKIAISKFRESRDIDGTLTFLKGSQRIELIKEMPIVNLGDGNLVKIKTLYKLKV